MRVSQRPATVVVGDGVVGLSIALHLSARDVPVTLLAPSYRGAASPASAGMLAASVERTNGPAQAFGDAARDAWPRLAALIRSFGGGDFEIRRDGIAMIARSDRDAVELRGTMRANDTWLSSDALRTRLPGIAECDGAVLYGGDGVVDAPAALAALVRALARRTNVEVIAQHVLSVESRGVTAAVTLANREVLTPDTAVIAAGAWSGAIEGLPRTLPVRPLRGTMVAVEGILTDVPVYDAEGHAYVFPRGSSTIIGATSDDVGFDATPLEADAERLIAAGSTIFPAIASLPRTAPWSGLRPMTPDSLAIIGKEPKAPNIVYACGHGRNGFLQAALTAEVVADIVLGSDVPHDISAFDPQRFDQPNQRS